MEEDFKLKHAPGTVVNGQGVWVREEGRSHSKNTGDISLKRGLWSAVPIQKQGGGRRDRTEEGGNWGTQARWKKVGVGCQQIAEQKKGGDERERYVIKINGRGKSIAAFTFLAIQLSADGDHAEQGKGARKTRKETTLYILSGVRKGRKTGDE